MKQNFNEIVQWAGAVLIIAGHALNAVGPAVYPYNVLTFVLGTIAFWIWAWRVGNKPQMFVNVISIAIGIVGLVRAIG